MEFWQDARNITNRLSGGEARADAYGIWRPPGHVNHRDMVDKLDHRARRTGDLRCWLCAAVLHPARWHLDHVQPLAAAGRHHIDNLEPACDTCNLVKGDRWSPLWCPPIDDFEPLWKRLQATPVEDVWRLDHNLAANALTAPRPVPVDPQIGLFAKSAVVIAVLEDQADPWRAMKLADIAAVASAGGARVGSGELPRDWLKTLGMTRTNGNGAASLRRWHDRRTPPHPNLVATRVRPTGGTWGPRGFRLRPPGGLPRPDSPIRWPDHDYAVPLIAMGSDDPRGDDTEELIAADRRMQDGSGIVGGR